MTHGSKSGTAKPRNFVKFEFKTTNFDVDAIGPHPRPAFQNPGPTCLFSKDCHAYGLGVIAHHAHIAPQGVYCFKYEAFAAWDCHGAFAGFPGFMRLQDQAQPITSRLKIDGKSMEHVFKQK